MFLYALAMAITTYSRVQDNSYHNRSFIFFDDILVIHERTSIGSELRSQIRYNTNRVHMFSVLKIVIGKQK